jgi:hypothetical protein
MWRYYLEKELTVHISCQDACSNQSLAREWLGSLSSTLKDELDVTCTWDTRGVKSPLALDWNTIILSFLASGGVLIEVVRLIQAKITKNEKVMIEIEGDKLEIVGSKVHTIDHDLLIDHFIKRHSITHKRKHLKK